MEKTTKSFSYIIQSLHLFASTNWEEATTPLDLLAPTGWENQLPNL